jgi:hypothetical protein
LRIRVTEQPGQQLAKDGDTATKPLKRKRQEGRERQTSEGSSTTPIVARKTARPR